MKRVVVLLAALVSGQALHAAGDLQFQDVHGTLTIRAVADDVVRIAYLPAVGTASGSTIVTRANRVSVSPASIRIQSADASTVVTIDRARLAAGAVALAHAVDDHLYGLRSYGLRDARDPGRGARLASRAIGPPERTIATTADLAGHAPLFPRWAMGFMNSQWKTDEAEVRSIVSTYRAKDRKRH